MENQFFSSITEHSLKKKQLCDLIVLHHPWDTDKKIPGGLEHGHSHEVAESGL